MDQTLGAELLAECPGESQTSCGQLCALSQKRKKGRGRSLEERSVDSMRLRGWFREERVAGQERSVFKAVLSAHRAGQARTAMPHVLRQQAQGCSRAVSCRLQTPEKPGPGAGAGQGGC